MTAPKASSAPLIAMIMVYMIALLGAAGNFFMGLMWGSEVYRDRGMPIAEWAMVAGPLVLVIAMLTATIVLWNKGQRRIPYALFAALLLGCLALANYTGLLAR